MSRRRLLLLALPLLWGCGTEQQAPGEPLPPEGCADPLALPQADGSCPRPGVPTDGCGPGFSHDGGYGCEPVLPAAPCPPATMAVPGETACRPVMPCGEGTWGDIARDATTQHVDASHLGPSDGSDTQPWTTITEAITAAAPGAVVAIAEGLYPESLGISAKPVQLRGVCPERVTVAAPATGVGNCPPAAVCVEGVGADGSVVSGLSLTGAGVGVFLSGTGDLLLHHLRIHDNAVRGVNAQDTAGPTSVTIRSSLIENNVEFGVYAGGATVSLEASVVRDTQPRAPSLGIGVMLSSACIDLGSGPQCDPTARSQGTILGSVIEHNQEAGVAAITSDLTLEDSVVRDTLPRSADGDAGHGVSLWSPCTDPLASCAGTAALGFLRRNVVERNHTAAVFLSGSEVVVEASVLRDNLAKPLDQTKGAGLILQSLCAVVDGALMCSDQGRSRGTLRRSLLTRNQDVAIFVSGSDLTMEDTVVSATQPRALDGINGRGVNIQAACAAGGLAPLCNAEAPSTASIHGSLITDSRGIALFVGGSAVDATASVIRRTEAHVSDGLFGDGVVYVSLGAPASGRVEGLLIEDSARAGIGTFGAELALASTTIRCAPFALTGEDYEGRPFQLVDEGANLCECGDTAEPCKVVNASLDPPGL